MPADSRSSIAACVALALVSNLLHGGTSSAQRPASAADAGEASRSSLPLEMPRGTLIAVRGDVAGLEGLRLLLDTGTSRTIVDERIARQLGLRGTPDWMEVFGQRVAAERVVLPSIGVGPIHTASLSVLAADLSDLGDRLGWRPDAIIGLDVLRGHCFVVDYDARRLIFACTTGWASQVMCDPKSPYVIAPLVIDGRDHRLLVDTGSDVVAIFERAASHLRLDDRQTVGADHMAGTVRLRRATAAIIVIGGQHRRRQPIVLIQAGNEDAGYDGVLGVGWLAGRVQLDLQRMVVRWPP